MATEEPRRPPSGLLHPVALAALAAWLVNDYVLKDAYPGWITGKLSDVAGLVVFPLVIAALVGVGLPGRLYPRVVDGSLIATALAFAIVKLWEPGNDALERLLGMMQPGTDVVVVRDVTDLIALPMLAVSRWCYRATKTRSAR